jgi:hypothetical protein
MFQLLMLLRGLNLEEWGWELGWAKRGYDFRDYPSMPVSPALEHEAGWDLNFTIVKQRSLPRALQLVIHTTVLWREEQSDANAYTYDGLNIEFRYACS